MSESKFTLLERSAKRASFLRTAGIVADVSFRVLERDLHQTTERFDLVVFRALTPLDKELSSLKRLLRRGGYLAAYKGRRSRIEEALVLLSEELIIYPLKIPFLEEERHLVLIGSGRD